MSFGFAISILTISTIWLRHLPSVLSFIDSDHDKGVPFWAVTVQNEPEFPAPWE